MKKFLILCTFFLTLMGCKDDSESVIQLLVNTDMEAGATSPNSWWDNENTVYITEWSTEEASSGIRSLKISTTQSDAVNFAFWAQSYEGAIPVGKDVVLSVKVKCKNMSGQGVSIAVRGDESNATSATQFSTTQGKISITGDFDWTTYQVRLEDIQSDIKSLYVYFVFLPNTVGDVYFDDATLTVQ